MPMRLLIGERKIIDICGPADITKETTDAIVNAANSSLMGGGGVDGAIHHAGGPAILEECRGIVSKTGELPEGQAVITTGGRLPAKYVIHTVGPIYSGGGSSQVQALASCHRESLKLADAHGLRSISFPAISTGSFGYPVQEAAPVALSSAIESLRSCKSVVLCRFVLFSAAMRREFESAAERLSKSNSSFRIQKEPS